MSTAPLRLVDRVQGERCVGELVQSGELARQRRVELVAARQGRLVGLGVERHVDKEIAGRQRRAHPEAEPDRVVRALHPGTLRGQGDDPAGAAWAPAGAEMSRGAIAECRRRRARPAARTTRCAGADRASLTHEADGNGGLVLRSDMRDEASLPAQV